MTSLHDNNDNNQLFPTWNANWASFPLSSFVFLRAQHLHMWSPVTPSSFPGRFRGHLSRTWRRALFRLHLALHFLLLRMQQVVLLSVHHVALRPLYRFLLGHSVRLCCLRSRLVHDTHDAMDGNWICGVWKVLQISSGLLLCSCLWDVWLVSREIPNYQ